MYNEAIKQFEQYVSMYDLNTKELQLKIKHSYEVANIMGIISSILNFTKEEIELAKTIGILHDIGRFEQFTTTKKFKDIEFDHANYSIDYLFENNNIRDFIQNNQYDEIIKEAIYFHNKKDIDKEATKFTKLLRDSDKIDIFRVYAVYYNQVFNLDITQKVLKDFYDEKPIDNMDVKTQTDGLLKVLAFLFDFNYQESIEYLNQCDNFMLMLSAVDYDNESEDLFTEIKKICYRKLGV